MSTHYLGSIRIHLERLYDEHPNDPALREHISDEVDWIDSESDRRAAFKQVFDFLDSIEGAGYGGIAEFEIARETMRSASELSPAALCALTSSQNT